MRLVGRYRFHTLPHPGSEQRIFEASRVAVEDWLSNKGSVAPDDPEMIVYADGRAARVSRGTVAVGESLGAAWTLEEPIAGGLFSTALSLARSDGRIDVSVEMAAGQLQGVVAPFAPEARCPRVIRDILSISTPWHCGNTLLRYSPVRACGPAGGQQVIAEIRDPRRQIPLIVVSEQDRFALHNELPRWLAADLAGLGIVFHIDESAGWELTHDLGQVWSCFGGAVRIYWAGATAEGDEPRRHPLWVAHRLLADWADPRDAAEYLRRKIRSTVLGLSTFAFESSGPYEELVEAAERAALEKRKKEAKTGKEWTAALEEDNAAVHEKLRKTEEKLRNAEKALSDVVNEREALKAAVENLTVSLLWQSKDEGSSATEGTPGEVLEPVSLSDVVAIAAEKFRKQLVFGADVERGVRGMSPIAGPPRKVLECLDALAELADARRKGEAGMPTVPWLRSKGFDCSGEAENLSDAERKKRRFHDGQVRKEFDLHMKPNEGTSPDKCVRIYFDWEPTLERFCIGWIGRHPE